MDPLQRRPQIGQIFCAQIFSSSSSSNGAPSEPTLDLPAWSPRSRKLDTYLSHTPHNIPKSATEKGKKNIILTSQLKTDLLLSPGSASPDWSSAPSGGVSAKVGRLSTNYDSPSLCLFLHGSNLVPATGNQNRTSDICRFTSEAPLIHLDLLSIPNPIHFNALPSPHTPTIHACTIEPIIGTAVQAKEGKYTPLSLAHPLRFGREEKGKLSLCLSDIHKPPNEMIIYAFIKAILTQSKALIAQPKHCTGLPQLTKPVQTCLSTPFSFRARDYSIANHCVKSPSLMAHYLPERRPTGHSKQSRLLTDFYSTTRYHLGPYLMTRCLMGPYGLPRCLVGSYEMSRCLTESYEMPRCLMDPHEMTSCQTDPPLMVSNLVNFSATDSLEALPATSDPQILADISHSITVNNTPGRKMKRIKQLPTRRSLRIQEKNQTGSKLQSPIRARPHSNSLPFDLQNKQDPLDANMTLAILQASGLEINKRVEELIAEATRQDHETSIADLPMPTTPLHDLVPPMQIPESDLLL